MLGYFQLLKGKLKNLRGIYLKTKMPFTKDNIWRKQ
jgi:hypothetical protein